MMTIVLRIVGLYLMVGAFCEIVNLKKNWSNIEFQSWGKLFTELAKRVFVWPMFLYRLVK